MGVAQVDEELMARARRIQAAGKRVHAACEDDPCWRCMQLERSHEREREKALAAEAARARKAAEAEKARRAEDRERKDLQ